MKQDHSSSPCGQAVAEAIVKLREELVVVRQVLDEVLNELQWANRNRSGQDDSWRVARPITSMPADPCAPDWAERLNRYSAADLPADEPDAPAAEAGRLF